MTQFAYDITSSVKPKPGGVARYVHEFLRAALDEVTLPEDRLLLGFRTSRWRHRAVAYRWAGPRTRVRPFASGIARWAFGGADVYHGLGVNVPKGLGKMPRVITLHAIFQDDFRWDDGGRGAKTLRAVGRADLVILPSEFDRVRALDLLRLPPERAVSVHHGVDHARFRPAGDPAQDEATRVALGLRPGRPYLVAVGGFNERKNYDRLAQGFARSSARAELDLVLCGALEEEGREILARIEALGLGEAVRRPGYVQPDQVPALLRGATLAAVPSLKESFGLPAIEAMACGAPLVFANTHALPEVAGEAGEPCDPYQPDSIAAAIDRALAPSRREELRVLGLARAATFTWARCVRNTFACYERLLGRPIPTRPEAAGPG